VDYSLSDKIHWEKGGSLRFEISEVRNPKEISTVDREEGHRTVDPAERSTTQVKARSLIRRTGVHRSSTQKIEVHKRAGFES
jgi:hypothetical protein